MPTYASEIHVFLLQDLSGRHRPRVGMPGLFLVGALLPACPGSGTLVCRQFLPHTHFPRTLLSTTRGQENSGKGDADAEVIA